MRIALLEDDASQSELIRTVLANANHHCYSEEYGQNFIKLLRRESFDVIIIDWELPDTSGLEVLQWIRHHIDWPIPVIFTTHRDMEEDIVLALENGADDYMIKPVKHLELLARLKVLYRRSVKQQNESRILDFETFQINVSERVIVRQGEKVNLTPREFQLALFLFQNIGRLVSKAHIMENVWGQNPDLNTRTVDTHISRIRQKLLLGPGSGWRLSTIYQHGYRLERSDFSY